MKAQPTDSTGSYHVSQLLGSIAASYSTSKNYTGTDFQNLAFSSSFFWQHDGQRETLLHSHKLLADLSYLKFIDSTWAKGIDRVQANFLWSRSAKKWTHSYSAMLATQFLPNEQLVYDEQTERTHTERFGGPLSPGILELSYGATWVPWPLSTVQFSFATVRLLSNPKAALQSPAHKHLAESANTVFDMQYGGSLLISINHPLNDRVLWMNNSRVFCNAFDRDHIAFELMNRFGIKLWKYLQLRLDTRMGYDPLVNYKLKFSQEVMLGIFYERPR